MARGSPRAFRRGERGIHRVRHGIHLCRAGRRTRRAPHTDTPFLTRPSCAASALPQLLQYLDYSTRDTLPPRLPIRWAQHRDLGLRAAEGEKSPPAQRARAEEQPEAGAQTGTRAPGASSMSTAEPRAVKHFGPASLHSRDAGPDRGGGWGIRTPEGLHPTRFPSVRHRPLGESSSTHRSALDHPKR